MANISIIKMIWQFNVTIYRNCYINNNVERRGKMLDITKILVISNEISDYERIKSILDSLNFFQLDYQTNIKRENNHYDFIIADLDSIDESDESKVVDSLKQVYKRSNIILLGKKNEVYLSKTQKGIPILSKSILEVELLEYLFNTILEEVSNICS